MAWVWSDAGRGTSDRVTVDQLEGLSEAQTGWTAVPADDEGRATPDDVAGRGKVGVDGEPSSFRGLLTDRVFAPFFFANSISNTGNWFQNVAAGIVVFQLTGSNAAVGAVSILQFAATMLLTPYAGVITDRVNRRWMLFTGQAVALLGASGLAIAVAVLGVEGLGGPLPVYAATAVVGLGAAIILPSLQALVPALVRKRQLDDAIALNAMTFNIARAIGPVAAGLVVAQFGAAVAFGVNAFTFLPLLVALALINPRSSVQPDPENGADGGVIDTVQWIRNHRTVVVLLMGTLAVGWTSDPFSTLMPGLADDFGYGETVVGLLVGAFGVGAAVTAPASGAVRRLLGRPNVIPVGLVLVAAGLGIMAAAPIVQLALVGAAISGSGFLLGVTGTNVELQKGIPDEVRGRVMAFWSVAFLGCRPLAAAVDGFVADATSVRTALILAGLLALTAAGLLFRYRPTAADIGL